MWLEPNTQPILLAHSSSILCLCETFYMKEYLAVRSKSLFLIIIMCDRSSRTCGGVCVCIKLNYL